jgi:hypothetical protein
VTLYPWLEVLRSSSDTYQFIERGPIQRTSAGEDEERYRVGLGARVFAVRGLRFDSGILVERVEDFGFETGESRTNVGISLSMFWYPAAPLGTLGR